jgi:hypothetical protein
MVAELWQNAVKHTSQQGTTPHNTLGLIMERIVLVGFLPDGNGRSCGLHPFGCGNSLVLNREDSGVGLHLRLRSFVPHELACYTMNDGGSDGCRVCFTAREYAAGENYQRLDGCIVKLTDVFTAEHENRSMRYLFHRNCGYAYAVVVSYAN